MQKLFYLSSFSVLLTMMTLIFSAPFLRAISRSYSAVVYWLLGLFVVAALGLVSAYPLQIFVGALWISVGIQLTLESKGYRWWASGICGLILGSGIGFLGTYLILNSYDLTNYTSLVDLVDGFIIENQLGPMVGKVSAKNLLPILPGLFVVMIELAMGFGLIFEKSVFRWFDLPRERYVSHSSLMESRLPDGLIWFSLITVLITFVDFKVENLNSFGMNLLSVISVLYFFQGIAILESFLKAFRIGFVGKSLIYFLLVGQLLPLVSLIGFIDYWLDFRRKIRVAVMNRKKSEP